MTTIAFPSRTSPRRIARELLEARARTFLLTAPLADEELRAQHDPLMSPILWDLGHIAHFEELWLTHNLNGPIEFVEMPGLFNPFEHPRSERGSLALPGLAHCQEVMEEIRERVLERLATAELDSSNPLLREAYVYRMVLQHEYQHNETILQTLQLKRGRPYTPVSRFVIPAAPGSWLETGRGNMVRFPGGPVVIGTSDHSVAYDNERDQHRVHLAPFWIDLHPVTNGDFEAFIAAGGYSIRDYWSDAGWKWVQESGAIAPQYWQHTGDVWITRAMDQVGPIDPSHPVCHVCYHEAEAFARFAGKRLPTENEWEAAASWDPESGIKSTFPWGEDAVTKDLANVDQLSFGTAPVGSYPQNVSPIGCYGMIGDVWEWTSSDFQPYPGFESFPYKEYSEAFFGSEYKVLRGGSWATRPGAIRNTFRNWDYPIRRQIFSGFRCARDA
ncbi:MAG TPA: ergothioneine biosynthesis protein EgtB [Gemmatimonadales bacterium]|nr:ergothioneine biosynthesis protein EgtB [Gemmatimonadales bacterium]